MNLLVFGMGNSGWHIARRMKPRLTHVWGTSRSPKRLAQLESLDVEPILFDGTVRSELSEAIRQADFVVVSTPPDESGDPVLRSSRQILAADPPEALVYLSTVGVYGNYDGEWVTEESRCRPVSERSTRRVAAENDWLCFHEQTGVPVAVLRLSGIYGNGPKPFDNLRNGTARRIIKKDQVFNRIHLDDIAAIADAALSQSANGIFNATDDEPAPPQDVVAYAAGLIGLEPPPDIPFEEADLTPMGRTFYGENKRVSNDKIKRELGVELAHPTYRQGLRAMLQQQGD